MQVRPREQLVSMLRADQLDLAVMVRAPSLPSLAAEPFAANPFVLVASPMHPLAAEREIPVARIASECLLVRESGTDTRIVADDIFLSLSNPPRFMELGCSEAIKQSVIAGMGVSLLSAQEVQADVRAGLLTVLAVQGLPVKRQWHVVHCGDRPLPSVARGFRQFLLDEAALRLAPLAVL
jgi:DNA-binding transcriptional LysR family regulator